MLHDDANIYVLVEVFDDALFEEDKIEFYFDIGGDRSGAYARDDSYITINEAAEWNRHDTMIAIDGGGVFNGPSASDQIYAFRFPKSSFGQAMNSQFLGLQHIAVGRGQRSRRGWLGLVVRTDGDAVRQLLPL